MFGVKLQHKQCWQKLKLLNIYRCTQICFVILPPASNPVVATAAIGTT